MSLDAFLDKDVQEELRLRDERLLELETKLRDWQRWYEGIGNDFVGLTTDRNDPSRTRDWEWIDENRPAPSRIEFEVLET